MEGEEGLARQPAHNQANDVSFKERRRGERLYEKKRNNSSFNSESPIVAAVKEIVEF